MYPKSPTIAVSSTPAPMTAAMSHVSNRRFAMSLECDFTSQSSLCKLSIGMRILRASHLGMCFGVRDAIALAIDRAAAGPLTILGDLVHNPTVLRTLEDKGIAVAHDVANVTTPTVMVTAHGASHRALARTRSLGLTVVEATC